VTVDGEPATWVTLLPHLLTIWQKESLYRRVWPCRCRSGPCHEVPEGAELPGGQWSACPFGLLRGPQFQALLSLHECARISPVAGWPDRFPAWLAWGLVTLRRRLEVQK